MWTSRKKNSASPYSAEFKSLTLYFNLFSQTDRYCAVLAKLVEAQALKLASSKLSFRTVTEEDLDSMATISALQVAIRVSYSVPFKRSNERFPNDILSTIPPGLAVMESEVERQLHGRIIEERDKGVAHWDASMTEPDVAIYESGYLSAHEDLMPLSLNDLHALRKMLHRYQERIGKRLGELKDLLPHGEY